MEGKKRSAFHYDPLAAIELLRSKWPPGNFIVPIRGGLGTLWTACHLSTTHGPCTGGSLSREVPFFVTA